MEHLMFFPLLIAIIGMITLDLLTTSWRKKNSNKGLYEILLKDTQQKEGEDHTIYPKGYFLCRGILLALFWLSVLHILLSIVQ